MKRDILKRQKSEKVEPMRALIAEPDRSLPGWASVAVWLPVFLSPTAYCLCLGLANQWHLPAPPASILVSLFCVIPIIALLVCTGAAWRSALRKSFRLSWVVATVLAMMAQVAALLWLIAAVITAAIALPQ